jgi:hypothetical protein
MLAGSSEAKCRELIDNDTVLNPPLLVTRDDPSCESRSGLKLDVKSSPTSGDSDAHVPCNSPANCMNVTERRNKTASPYIIIETPKALNE